MPEGAIFNNVSHQSKSHKERTQQLAALAKSFCRAHQTPVLIILSAAIPMMKGNNNNPILITPYLRQTGLHANSATILMAMHNTSKGYVPIIPATAAPFLFG